MPKAFNFIFLLALCLAGGPSWAQKRGPDGPVSILAAPVTLQNFTDSVEALGTTKSNESVVITADTAEKVTEIHFEDGQRVKKGDLLISLDKSEEIAELSSATASLSQAQSSYDRAKGLQETSALSKGTLQERLAVLKQNQASIEEIKARIEKRNITAPFDGVLGLREVSLGALIQPGDVITTIDDLSRIKIDFDVPTLFLPSLKAGMPIMGKVEVFGDRVFAGVVHTINTQIDPVTRTVKMRAIVENKDGVLKPGLLMNVILEKNLRRALLIPEEALIKRGADNFVFLVVQKDGKTYAQQTKIEIGMRKPGVIEVRSGLREGEHIVVDGTVKISDGTEITVRALKDKDTPLIELLEPKPDEK
ncbi:MAG: efflux RND transporter periplasmic adaptor subunit [Alphaproteobacteria bacterium]|nr:efflux RND transporter periplasmic adaptor subunit [Alphaproteobacteria bacterium]